MEYKENINKLIKHLQSADKGLEDSSEFESELYAMGFDKGARMMMAYLLKYGFISENEIESIRSLLIKNVIFN